MWRSMLERQGELCRTRAGQEGTKSPFWAVRGEGTSCAQQQEGSGLSCRVGARQVRGHPDAPSPRRTMPLCAVDA